MSEPTPKLHRRLAVRKVLSRSTVAPKCIPHSRIELRSVLYARPIDPLDERLIITDPSLEHIAVASAVRTQRSRLVSDATARISDQRKGTGSHSLGWVPEAIAAEVVALTCIDAAGEFDSVGVCVGGDGLVCNWRGDSEEKVA